MVSFNFLEAEVNTNNTRELTLFRGGGGRAGVSGRGGEIVLAF